jgi:Protein ENHANCED DISEASE RESISTANCE 2, C-terminal
MIAYKLMALCFVMCINNNRSTVGGKPALVGTKIKQVYHRGEGYFEIETDICSSTAALYILGVVKVSSSRSTSSTYLLFIANKLMRIL